MELIFIIALVLISIYLYSTYYFLKKTKNTANYKEKTFGMLYSFSFLLFLLGFSTHKVQYNIAIDIVDGFECYIPFSKSHLITLLFYFILFTISIFLIWTTNYSLPPLTYIICLIFTLIGVLLNSIIILQVSSHNTKTLDAYYHDEGMLFFILFPTLSIVIGMYLILKAIKYEAQKSMGRKFNNNFLTALNNYIASQYSLKIWVLLLFFPVLFISTLVLLLLGQDMNSLVKVFTDTTTWRFSQQIHPPVLDHQGHYICTVAACGNPKIVKPIRLGKRNGNCIIVNRQLQIANAFEEMVHDFSPTIHHIIRNNYDQYGYNFSKYITTTNSSNITYLLMKPLEWLFLVCLYLFCVNPEKKIQKQYSA